jgi:hypothetical protein
MLGVFGSSSLDLVVPEPCSSAIDARVKLETASTVSSGSCVGEIDPIEVGRTHVSDLCVQLTPNSLSVGVSLHD